MTRDAPATEIERLFELAIEHAPAERAVFLDRACSDPDVRRELESLLRADAEAGQFLQPPLPACTLGLRIGHYRLVRKIGEGETSSVYLAFRDDGQYHHRVAIKLIRPGIGSRLIVQRFQQERQILASLTHPNIARLLDGGSTSEGQPYFVMEHVDGEPLDIHCDHAGLSLTRRLELFCAVCEAVHFAHRNLVVHRDLKPANILVDADGMVKLVDFGIAKLLDPASFRIHSEPTAAVARLMTPHYASPEQVMGKPISTASDVYSLGVIAYKLITGQRPYELTSYSLEEIERVVGESTPHPPSQVSRMRESWPRDLDNVVLMAMRKEPERRYASAKELADDIRRCLDRRPVLARPDTLGYRASSFVRRNTGAVAAAVMIFVSLVFGTIATTWQWRNAVAERTRAVAERTHAEARRQTAEHTLWFLVELFKAPDPQVAMTDVTAHSLLERGVARLRTASGLPMDVRAALEHTLGVVHRNLGDFQQATALLAGAVAARSSIPDGQLDLADSLYQLGLIDALNGNTDRGASSLRRALAIRTQILGPDDLTVAQTLEALAEHADGEVSIHEAQVGLRRALDIHRRHAGGDQRRQITSTARLAELLALSGQHDQAEALMREAIAIRARIPESDRCTMEDVKFLDNLATFLYREAHFDDAEGYSNASIECAQQLLGPDHVEVADLTSLRVLLWSEKARYAEAEELGWRSLERRRALHGPHSSAVDHALHILASVLYRRGKLVKAARLETEALTMRRRAYGHSHVSIAVSLVALGDIALAGLDVKTAETSYQEALAISLEIDNGRRPVVAIAMRGLAATLLAQGKIDAGKSIADRALAAQRSGLRPHHPEIAGTLAVLGTIAAVRSPAAAEPLFREALAIQKKALPPEHPAIAHTESLLGECLVLQHKASEALPLLRHGAEILHATLGDDHLDTRRARGRLQTAESRTAGE
jgi:eukaryotic-like serine/threonine-protein kinase